MTARQAGPDCGDAGDDGRRDARAALPGAAHPRALAERPLRIRYASLVSDPFSASLVRVSSLSPLSIVGRGICRGRMPWPESNGLSAALAAGPYNVVAPNGPNGRTGPRARDGQPQRGGRARREALASRPRAIYINTLTSGHLAICINTSTVRTFISRVKTSVQAACLQHAAKRSRREAGEPVGRCGRGGWLTRLRRGAVVFSRSQARLFELPPSLLLDKSSSYRIQLARLWRGLSSPAAPT